VRFSGSPQVSTRVTRNRCGGETGVVGEIADGLEALADRDGHGVLLVGGCCTFIA